MFEPLRYDSGKVKTLQSANSATISKGDALVFNSSGYLKLASSSDGDIPFVALEDADTGSSEHLDVKVVYTDGVEFEADDNAGATQSDVGLVVDLNDEETLDTGTSANNEAFRVTDLVSASDDVVKGYFTL